ncbi:MAG: enoyl-CoA hydratase/isomerase family protein [Thermodesulfobacteriota bacterium]
MEYEYVLYKKEGQVAYITLNRPERLNAVSPELVRDWSAAMTEAEDDEDVKVIVFKGAGRAFSAGADLTGVGFVYGMKEPKPGEKGGRVPLRVKLKFDRNLFLEFHRKVLLCPKLTIAQMHEYCLGIAFNIVLHCDLLIASEDCKVGHVEERLGQGGMTISPIMVLRCGLTRALDLCLTGKMIDGKKAAEWALVNRAVPKEILDDEVRELANGLALYPKDGIAVGKVARHMLYQTMGVEKGLVDHFIMHTLQTNKVYDPGEFNFFKQRRDKGVRDAAHEKHDLFKALDK